VSRTCLPLSFQIDGRPLAGETLCVEGGASVLVFTSCSAELGIELRSAYLDGSGGEMLVAQSAVLGAHPIELRSRHLNGVEGALTYERRRLLYDHLQALQDLAARTGASLAFDGIEVAAAALDPHSPFASRS
jgi:hypothetical protein